MFQTLISTTCRLKKLFSILIFYILKLARVIKMGCEQSKLSHIHNTISYSVIDPTYLKPANKDLRVSLEQNGVNVKTYMSVDCFISDQVDSYSNNVVIRQQNLNELVKALKQINSNPKIFVVSKNRNKSSDTPHNLGRISYIQGYEQLLQKFQLKTAPTAKQNKSKQVIDLKLLKDFRGDGQPQLFIFQQTLKIKNITYKIYSTFQELENEMSSVESKVVVTDYVFQNEVVQLLKNKKTKVICFCNLTAQQTYNPDIYFITNNFQEIANEVAILKSFQLTPLPITKIFLCSKNNHFFRFKSTLQEFQLQCREYNDVHEILKITKYYFSLMVICPEEQKANFQKELQTYGLSFRVQLFGLNEQSQNSPRGLRKILREIKRGYLVQRGVCKTVDIIDKYHNSSKFEDIKAQLHKNNINFRCFDDFNSYTKKLLYCSPFIICNFSERNLVYRFLEQVQSKSKIIIFCNKSKIGEELACERKWTFVSSHFGKIISYLKSHKIMVPVVLDQNQQKIHLKQEKIKNKQHRISALKWADPNVPTKNIAKQNSKTRGSQVLEVSYIVPKANITQLQVKQICHDASTLLKLDYHPVDDLEKFKKQLTESLLFLKEKYKLKYPETAFTQLLESIKQKSLRGLSKRVKQFFGEEKQMGFKINESLKKIQSLDQKQLKHIRQIIYLVNINFISFYQMPKIGTFKLVHWTKQTLLESCLDEGVVIFKNFLVMYEQGNFQPLADCLKLELEFDYSTLTAQNTTMCPYFYFEGRYIFAPYTQFRLKGKIKQNQSIASLQLIRQPDFLNYYFNQNIHQSLTGFYETQLKSESSLIQKQEHDLVAKNLQRSAILKLWRTCDHAKAAKRQAQLVKKQQQTENIDEKYLIQILYELANYQFKAGLTDDFLTTVQQITTNDACNLIKKECSALLQKLAIEIQRQDTSKKTKVLQENSKERTHKCIQLQQNLQQQIEDEDMREGENLVRFEQTLFQNQNCLEIDDIQQSFDMIK